MSSYTIWDRFWAWAGRVPLRQKIIGIIVAPLLILGTTMAWWVSNELGGWLSYLLSEERVAQAMAVGMRGVLIITVFAAVAGLGIGWLLTWILTRPVLDMTFVARHVKNGNLSMRAPVWANDEIGELGRAFNAMIQSLDSSRRELEQSNLELKQRNEELGVLYELADKANEPHTIDHVIAAGLQQALKNTNAEAGLVLLFQEQTPACAASHNLPDQFVAQALTCFTHFYLLDNASFRAGNPLVIDDIDSHPDAPAELILGSQRLGYQTFVLVPITAKGNVLGVLVALCRTPQGLSQRGHQLLNGICNQLGVTVENNRLWEELKHKERLRAQLLNKVVTAQEDERQRISRELHDETGQALTSLLVQLKILEQTAVSSEALSQVEEMRQVVARTLQEVRRLAADLRPAALDDLGLVPALEGYIHDFAQKNRITVDFLAETNDLLRLPRPAETVLYRVTQEALTNIARHAEASQVTVAMYREHEALHMRIEDDGQGFDAPRVLQSDQQGLGLLGMQERVELLGGCFELNSTPGRGTQLHVELPIVSGGVQGSL